MTTDNENNPPAKFGFISVILLLLLTVLLCGEAYFGYRQHALSVQQEQIKEDYSTVNNITFGLFSVDEWRDKISDVVNRQVGNFNMTKAQLKQLQKQVEQQLHGLITKTVALINKPQTTFTGKLKRFAFNKLVDPKQIQAQVPAFAKTIVDRINSPESKKRLRNIAAGKLNQLEKETFDSTETVSTKVTAYMYHKYHVSGPDEFNNKLTADAAAMRKVSYNYAYAMLGCVLLALIIWWLLRKQVQLNTALFVFSLLFAAILLTVGITSSIIEVDARIKTLNFMLLGEKVAFENQVLFFQRKSIWGIVDTLIEQSKPDAVLVGSLILLFVIILPFMRLLAAGIHLLSPAKLANSKVIRYITFEAGKWTMADVMVVGILMTYIGLNGILESQLSNLNIRNSFLTTITANNTSLQPGYIIFVGFVLFWIVIFAVLKRQTSEDPERAENENIESQ